MAIPHYCSFERNISNISSLLKWTFIFCIVHFLTRSNDNERGKTRQYIMCFLFWVEFSDRITKLCSDEFLWSNFCRINKRRRNILSNLACHRSDSLCLRSLRCGKSSLWRWKMSHMKDSVIVVGDIAMKNLRKHTPWFHGKEQTVVFHVGST